MLKAADELVGKLRSLAMADFRTLRAKHGSHERNHDLVDILYLVARFWASLELFRRGWPDGVGGQGHTGQTAGRVRGLPWSRAGFGLSGGRHSERWRSSRLSRGTRAWR